jgi:hypothetical protein
MSSEEKNGRPGRTRGRRNVAKKPASADLPQILQDMRHVYNNPASEDITQGQILQRSFMKEHYKDFMVALNRAEQIQSQREQEGGSHGKVDASHQMLEELIDQILEAANAK